jgi:hypothetical protein
VDSGLTSTTDASGYFAISGASVTTGDVLTVFLDNASEDGVTVTKAVSNDFQGFNIYQNKLIVRSENGATITNANLDTANNADSDIIAIYNDGALPTVNSGKELIIWTGVTFDGSSILTINGDLEVQTGSTFGTTADMYISGNFVNSGTISGSGNIRFYGTGTSQSFSPGTASMNASIFLMNSPTVTLQTNLTTTGTVAISNANATLSLNGKNLTASNLFDNVGTLRLFGSETVTIPANDTNSGTWEYVGDGDGLAETFTIKDFGTTDYNNIYINDTSASNSDSFQIASALTTTGSIAVVDGTFIGNTQAITAGVSVIISATGTMNSTSGTLTIGAGHFTNNGTFNHNNGTVTFSQQDTSHAISGITTFNNLTLIDSVNTGTDTLFQFEGGPVTIAGVLTVDGLDANDMVNITSLFSPTPVTIAFTGTSTYVGNFVDVQDSILTDASSAITLPLNPASSVDSGNTVGWFSKLTGILRPSEGSTSASMNGKTIRLLVNGVDSGVTATTANNAASGGLDGEFSLSKPVTVVSTDILTLYVDDDATVDAVTVTRTDNSTLTGFELIQDTLKVQYENGTSLTSANLNTANNGDTDITAIYADAATLTTVAGKDLLINTGDTFAPGSAVVLGGDMHVLSTGTYNGSTFAISVAGNLDNDGTWTHTGTITFNGGTTQTFNPGSATIGSDIATSGLLTTVALVDNNLNIGANTLTIGTNSVFSLNGKNLTLTSTFSNNGTFRLQGAETITSLTQDIDSGIWEYVGDGDSAVDAYTIKDFGTTDYFNIVIASTDTVDTYSSAAAKSIAGSLNIQSGTYNASTSTTTVTNITTVGGTYLTGTATQTFGAGGLNITGTMTMSTGGIIINGNTSLAIGTFTGSSGTVDMNGNLTLTSGTFTAPSGTGATAFTISGNFTNTAATFNHNSGTVTFDASTNHTITGSTTWNNVTFSEASNTTTDSILTIEAGSTQTITGTLSVDGLDANDMLNIVSSIPGTMTYFNFTGTGTVGATRDFLDITDNTLIDNSTAFIPPVSPASSFNGGNTVNWFSNITGVLRPGEGTTNATMNGKTIRLLKNGVDSGLTATTAFNAAGGGLNGEFSIATPVGVVSGDILTLFVDNDLLDAVTVTRTDGVTFSGLDLIQTSITVRHEDAGPITNTNLDTGNNGDTDITSLFTNGTTTALTTVSGASLIVNTGDTYTPGGTTTVSGLIHISGSAILNAAANAVNVAFNFLNDGTFTSTGTLTFNGTGSQLFDPGSATIGADIAISNGSGTVRLANNNLNIGANTVTLGVGSIFSLEGRNLTFSSTFSNDGTLQLQGTEAVTTNGTTLITNDVNSGTWEYIGDGDIVAETVTIKDFGTTDYFNLIINDSAATNIDTHSAGAALTIAGALSITDGIVSVGANALTVTGATTIGTAGTLTSAAGTETFTGAFTSNGSTTFGTSATTFGNNVTISGGTTTATSGTTTVTGSWDTTGGTFTHNSGTVVFTASTNHTLSGSTSFNNLTMTEAGNNATDSTITIGAGSTQTINGTLVMDGLDTDDRLNLVSSSSGSVATILFAGTSTFSSAARDFLDVKDSVLTDSSSGVTVPINPTSSLNSGNTTNWFTNVGGILRPSEGTTSASMNGKTIRVLKNGVDTGETSVTANNAAGGGSDGEFAMPALTGVVSGDVLTFFVDGDASVDAAAVVITDALTYSGFELIQNAIYLRSDTGAVVTPTTLNTAHNADGDLTTLYTDGSNTTLTTGTGVSLIVNTADIFTPAGSVTLGGGLHVQTGATYASAANALTIAGNFDNDGTFTHTNTITFNGTTDQTFNAGSAAIGSDLNITNTTGVVSVVDNNLNIGANTLTIATNAVFALAGKNLTISSTFSNNGTFRLYGTETITTITQDTNSGTWEYVGDGDGIAETITLKDFGTTDYFNLLINDTSGVSDSFQLGAGFYAAGALTVTDGAFLGQAQTMDIDGNLTIGAAGNMTATTNAVFALGGDFTNAGVWSHTSGTLTLDKASGVQTITPTAITSFATLKKLEASNDTVNATLAFAGDITITTNLNLDGLDANDKLLITSTTPGVARSITMTGASTVTAGINFLTITDNNLIDSSTGVLLPINPASSVNGGNTSGWFTAVTGILRPSEGTASALMNGITIKFLVNGVDTGQTAVTANNAAGGGLDGEFNLGSTTAVSGDILTFFVDDATVEGVSVTVTNASTLSGFEIIQDTLKVQYETGSSITAANLNTANNGDANITAIYSDAATLTTAAGKDFLINTGDTFTPAGAVVIGGDMHVMSTATYSGAATAISVAGNLDNDGTWTQTAGASIIFNGTTDQMFNPGSAALSNTDISVTNTGGVVTLVDNNLNIGINNLTIASNATFSLGGKNVTVANSFSNDGTLRLRGSETVTFTAPAVQDINSGTWEYIGDGDSVADTFTIIDFGATDYFNLSVNSTDTLDTFVSAAAKTISGAVTITNAPYNANGQTTTIAGNTTINTTGNYIAGSATQTHTSSVVVSGIYTGSTGIVDVNGASLTVNVGGTFVAPSTSLTLAGNFTNAGTFTGNGGTVVFDPSTNHTISGSSTWYNLTMSEAGNNATDSTITFEAGTTQTITGTLFMDGLDTDDRLNITSSTSGVAATINLSGTSTFSSSGDFLDVTDNAILDNSSVETIPLNPLNSIDGGNTTNWFGSSITGTVYIDEGVTNIGAGKTIRVLSNGVQVATATTDVNGAYAASVSPVIASGAIITVHIDGAAEDGVTVTNSNGADITGLNIYVDHVIVRNENGTALTLANLNTANDGDADITALYSDGASPIFSSSSELYIWTGKTFNPGAALDLDGSLEITTGATLTQGAFAVNVAKDFNNTGTFTHTGVLTFDGTGTQQFAAGSATIGSDVVINASSVTYLVLNSLNIGANDLTIGGTLNIGALGLTATGTFSNNGYLSLVGGNTISLTQDIDSGTWQYTGNTDTVSDTYIIKDFGATDYYNFELLSGDANDIFQLGTALSIAGTFVLTEGSYFANAFTTSVTGLTTIASGSYNASSATQTFGAGLTTTGGSFFGSTGTVDINGNLSLTNNIFLAPSGSLTISGNFTKNSGSFVHNSGTVIFDTSTNHTISGSTTWNNLTITEASNNSADSILTIEAGTTHTIVGALTLDGLDTDDRLNIVSSNPGVQTQISFSGTSTFTGDFLDISDSAVNDNSSNITTPINPANSLDTSNTLNWFGYVSGRVFSDAGVTGLNGATIRVLVNGVDTGITATSANNAAGGGLDGEYIFNTIGIAQNDIVTLYIDNNALDGVTVTRFSTTSATDYDIYAAHIIIQTETTSSLSNADLDTANNGDTDITSLYSDGGTSTVTTLAGSTLYIRESGITTTIEYAPEGAVDINGDITLDFSTTVFASAVPVTVSGDFISIGSWVHTGIVTFDGTTAQTFYPYGAGITSDIVIANTSNVVTLDTNVLNIGANDLTINTNATLSLAGTGITASGTFSNNGTVRLVGSEAINLTQDTNSGTWEYVGDGDSAADTFTIKDFGTNGLL